MAQADIEQPAENDPEPGGEIRVLNIEFSFAKTGLTPCGVEYHDVAIYSQCSADSGEDLIFSAPQMALCEMEALRILLPETCAFRLVASSIAGGPPDTLLAQVPNNGWTPAQFAIDPPASTVEFPQSMDGTVAIPTMLIKATPDAGGGFTVEDGAEQYPVQAHAERHDLRCADGTDLRKRWADRQGRSGLAELHPVQTPSSRGLHLKHEPALTARSR